MIRYVSNRAGREALLDVRPELPEPRCRTCGRHQLPGEFEGWGGPRRPLDANGEPGEIRLCVCGACFDCHDRGERRRRECPPMTRR